MYQHTGEFFFRSANPTRNSSPTTNNLQGRVRVFYLLFTCNMHLSVGVVLIVSVFAPLIVCLFTINMSPLSATLWVSIYLTLALSACPFIIHVSALDVTLALSVYLTHVQFPFTILVSPLSIALLVCVYFTLTVVVFLFRIRARRKRLVLIVSCNATPVSFPITTPVSSS